MSDKTGIQWTDATWNPIRGCSLVSAGCTNCYAMGVAARFSGEGLPYEGLARRRSNGKPQWTGEIRVIESHMLDPIRWQRPRKIFVNSMSDLFHENVSIATIARVWAVMALAPRHTYQILTKRPERMLEVITTTGFYAEVLDQGNDIRRGRPDLASYPISNPKHEGCYPQVWLGVSTENQATADERIPILLDTPGAVRFISAEPLLGPIDLTQIREQIAPSSFVTYSALDLEGRAQWAGARLDWVIIGGESGPNARPCYVSWIRSLVAQCRSHRVPVFVKQLGARVMSPALPDWSHNYAGHKEEGYRAFLRHSHGADPSEWPEDLRIRDLPAAAVLA